MRAGGFHHDAKVRDPLGRQRRVPDRGRRAEGARRRRRRPRARAGSACAASRASSGRCTWAREPAACRPWASAWACSAWSSSTPATSPASRARARPSSTRETPAPGHRDDGGAEGVRRGRRRPRRHDAARLASPAKLRRGLGRRRGLRRDDGRRAAPPPLRGQQRATARRLEEAGLVFSRHPPRRSGSSSSSSCRARCTRTTSRPRRTRSSSRARPGRTRCSPGSSAPPSRRQRASRLVEVERPRHHEPAEADACDGPAAADRRPARPAARAVRRDGRLRGPRLGRRRATRSTSARRGVVQPRVRRPHRAPSPSLALDDRGPRRAHPAVPPPGRRLRVGAARPGCSTSTGEPAHGWRPPASCTRRPTSSPGSGTCSLDHYARPGGLDEALRVFLARDLRDVPPTTSGTTATARSSVCRCAGCRSTRSSTPCSRAACTTAR